jgi:hypothetical protein
VENDILIDGERLAWPEFADRLMALRDASAHEPTAGYVRAPRHCGAEARRLIRDLDLGDCIAVLDELPGLTQQQPARALGGWAPVHAALRSLFGHARQDPLPD